MRELQKEIKDEMAYEMRQKMMNKDVEVWEISFHIAFNQVVYSIVLLYSLVSPMITLFGALFFTIKYFVDKYNQIYIYPKLYDSKGTIA